MAKGWLQGHLCNLPKGKPLTMHDNGSYHEILWEGESKKGGIGAVTDLKPIFWGCPNFGWITLLVHFLVQKCEVNPLVLFNLNWFWFFKNWCNLIFFVKFLQRSKKFSSKLTLGLCLLHQQSKPFLLTTSILMKKPWSDSRNLMKKKWQNYIICENQDKIKT